MLSIRDALGGRTSAEENANNGIKFAITVLSLQCWNLCTTHAFLRTLIRDLNDVFIDVVKR
jgi:hypothetical protein